MTTLENQKLLLRSIFKSCGGPTELAKFTGFHRQNFTNWQIRGKVPLRHAVRVSAALGISKWGLNYNDFCEVSDSPLEWEEVVRSYFLPRGIIDKLLNGDKKCLKKKIKKKKQKHQEK